jgi:type IV fimbrial biogenesis protein FimT
VELLIAITIAAVLAALAVPSFQGTIRQNRLGAAADRLAGNLSLARSEAVKQGLAINIVNPAATTNWGAGWSSCCVPTAGGVPQSPLTVAPAILAPLTLHSSAPAAAGFQFDSAGRLLVPGVVPAPSLVFVLCADGNGLANNSRAVLIAPSGRVRVARNGTGAQAGIPIKDDGNPVASCTVP